MPKCSLCGLAIENVELARHYLSDDNVVDYVRSKHPGWSPENETCSRCLENYVRELSAPVLTGQDSDETTVVTTSPETMIPKSSEGATPSLITIHGVELGKKYDINDREMILGRGETTHIRINEENVSRQHARIIKAGSEVIVEDLKSTNGTFVNTKKITSHPLKDGDLILIGNTILKFASSSGVESRYHDEIYRLATLDGLTQVYNKAFFLDRLSEEFRRSKRYKRELTLILYDFDHFKELNDTYGHLAGDEVLKKASSLIFKNLRKEDVLGRYGGEEFGLILPETTIKSALQLGEKLRQMIDQTTFQNGESKIKATISIGIATLTKDLNDEEDLIEKTDQALYRAKQAGRNCVKT